MCHFRWLFTRCDINREDFCNVWTDEPPMSIDSKQYKKDTEDPEEHNYWPHKIKEWMFFHTGDKKHLPGLLKDKINLNLVGQSQILSKFCSC